MPVIRINTDLNNKNMHNRIIKPSELIVNAEWLHKALWKDFKLPEKEREKLIPMFFNYWRAKGDI